MKKRALCILLSISVLACLATVKGTFAWISFSDEVKSHTIEIGQLKYELIGDLGSNYKNSNGKHLIVPGENLIVVPVEDESSTTAQSTEPTAYEHSPLILRNYSTVDTQLRIKINYTPVPDVMVYKLAYQKAGSDKIEVIFPAVYTFSGDFWYYNTKTGSNLIPAVNPPLVTSTQETTTGETTTATAEPAQEWYEDIVIIRDIHYKGGEFDETVEGKEVSVTITIEVKQADYIDWVQFAQLELN
ncbi:MAG TPA: hypothetical protein VFD52_03630 [Clostridia bacterium]|nr:hypothetical protein [Clostridia bacterium]